MIRARASGLPNWRTSRYTVVQLPGEMDTPNADEVREQLLALLNAGGSNAGPLVVDLTGTTFCDSSAVNALLRAHTRASALGRRLYAAVSAGGIVRKIFDITAISRVIPTVGVPPAARRPEPQRIPPTITRRAGLHQDKINCYDRVRAGSSPARPHRSPPGDAVACRSSRAAR